MTHHSLDQRIEERARAALATRGTGPTLAEQCAASDEWDAVCPPPVRELLDVGLDTIRRGEGPRERVARAVARLIDHTALKPDTTETQIRQLCDEGRTFGFASVCVNPYWVPLCAERLQNSDVLVCTVIGFPLGATTTASKVAETLDACRGGADEVDMVLNVGALRSGRLADALADVRAVAEAAHAHEAVLKVIIETALLTDEEKAQACVLAVEAGADFVKTSTGFSSGGATIEDVALMRHVVGRELGVKASGGVRTLQDALAMIEAGATRIGASSGVTIVEQATSNTWADSQPSSSSSH